MSVINGKYPYKSARLVHYNYDLSRRWHVVFWAFDISTETMVRKRLFEPLNRAKYKTVRQRKEIAQEMIFAINRELREGKILGKNKKIVTEVTERKMKLLEAVAYVKNQKVNTQHRKSYTRIFNALAFNIRSWLEHSGRPDFPFKDFCKDDGFHFSDYLTGVKKLSNKSHNTYMGMMATVVSYMWKRDRKLFKENPIETDTLPTISRKHSAFTNQQMAAIKTKCIELGYHQLLLYIQTMYYTLARPDRELLGLTIGDVSLEQKRIFFRGENSKGTTDEYVDMPLSLLEIFKKSDVMNLAPDKYLFSIMPPHNYRMNTKYFYQQNKTVLKALGYTDKPYTIYSYKHSGAISLYTDTKDLKLLQKQMRHKTSEMTNTYLRDLGFQEESQELRQWKGAV